MKDQDNLDQFVQEDRSNFHHMMGLVKTFMEVGEQPIGESPQLIPDEIASFRFRFAEEEATEYLQAVIARDKTEVLDSLLDQLYVWYGTVLSHGMQDIIVDAFYEVHRSNMTKFPDGKVLKNPEGKVIKPETWEPPNLGQFLSDENK